MRATDETTGATTGVSTGGTALTASEEPDGSVATVRLRVLGRPTLLWAGQPRQLGTQKSLALLCYLAARDEPASRDTLAALLWPDSDEERARRSLRGELARLRSALPDGAITGTRLDIGIDTTALDVDVRRFRDLVSAEQDLEADVQAARLFRGPFCDGLTVRAAEPFDEWLRAERQSLETSYIQVLHRLIRTQRAHGDPNAALDWARRGIAFQPLNEYFSVQAMEAAEEFGDRSRALEIYRALQRALRTELGIGPGTEARAVARRLTGATGPPPTEATTTARIPARRDRGEHTDPAEFDQTEFIGHSTELGLLRGRRQQALHGLGSVVFVHGPAGVGKSRLVREALERTSGGPRTVWCGSQRSASRVPYFPIAAGLRDYLATWGVPAVSEVWLREAARVCPELGRAGHNTSLGAPGDKARLVEGLAATLAGAAGRGGVIVFDQIESADADTIAVLGDLVQAVPRLPVIVVITGRQALAATGGTIADPLTAASAAGHLTDIPLGDLTGPELRLLVRACASACGRDTDPSDWLDEFAGLVYQVLGGNPFSATECARLAFDASSDTPTDPISAIRSGIPDVVRARLAGLPRTLRLLTEAAATLGDPPIPDLLSRMLSIGPWEIADALDELVAKRILVSQTGTIRFAHHLIAEVIEDSLAPAKREMLHDKAAHALIGANSLNVDPVSSQIAAHFEAAGQPEAAIPYHERAAETARAAHAHQTAIRHYQRLRELVPEQRRVPLLLRYGELLSYGSTGDAERVYREALQLATLQGAGAEQAQCYFALGVLSRRRADLSGSRHALSEALRRFQIYGDLEGVEKTLEALTYAHIQEGDLAAAITAATRAGTIARDTGRLAHLGGSQLSLGIAHLYGGDYMPALESFEQARDIGLDTGDELAQAEALRYLSAVYGSEGRLGTPEQAWAPAERAIEICARVGHRLGLARAADGMGGAYLVAGDWGRALDCYLAGLNLKNTFGYAWGFDAMVYRVGYTLLRAHETDTANHVLHQAMTLSRNLNAPYWLCRTLLALAELHVDSAEPARARGYAAEAWELAEGLRHHDFIATARALVRRATHRPGSRRSPSRSPAAESGEPHRAALPDIPVVLETPVHGPEAIVSWLDPIIDRMVGAGS